MYLSQADLELTSELPASTGITSTATSVCAEDGTQGFMDVNKRSIYQLSRPEFETTHMLNLISALHTAYNCENMARKTLKSA